MGAWDYILGGPLYGAGKKIGEHYSKKRDRQQRKDYDKLVKQFSHSKSQRKLVDWLSKSITGNKANLDIRKSDLYQSGEKYLQGLLSGDSEAYQAFEAPALRQFREEIMPEIAEKYAGVGAGGSSAFGLAATHAGGALEEQLASMREGLRVQALPQALSYAQQPITNQAAFMGQAMNAQPGAVPGPFQAQPGFGEQLYSTLMQAGGTAAGAYLGGPGGAQMGSNLGSWLGGMNSGGGMSPGSQQNLMASQGYSMRTI